MIIKIRLYCEMIFFVNFELQIPKQVRNDTFYQLVWPRNGSAQITIENIMIFRYSICYVL